MDYSLISPNPILQQYVHGYWTMTGDEREQFKVVPDGFPELIFHFGETYKCQLEHRVQKYQPRMVLAGQLTMPLLLKPHGHSDIIGIKFRALGLWQLLGLNMALFTNGTVNAFDVLDINQHFYDRLLACNSVTHRIHHIETFLIQLLRQKRTSSIEPLLLAMQNEYIPISIKKLSQDHKMSLRKVERLFNEQLGISAKMYTRLLRFKKVYAILHQKEISKTQASYLCGYFDQAHFNKEFKQFSGEDPGSYFRGTHELSNFFMR